MMYQKEILPIISGLFIKEPQEIYHSKRNDFLTSTQIKSFLGFPGGKTDPMPAEVRQENFLVGKAAHTLILEGRDAFNRDFPENSDSGDQCASLNSRRRDIIEKLCMAVKASPEAADLLQNGVSESVVRTSFCNCPCQIRIDWFNPYRGLVDLKTTAALSQFNNDIHNYLYYEQLAFYRAVIREAAGVTVPVYFIIADKTNLKCEVRNVTTDLIDSAEVKIRAAIQQILLSRKPGQWTGPLPPPIRKTP